VGDPVRLVFLHIPKTGGTTLAGILRREYGSSGVRELYETPLPSQEELSGAGLVDARVIIGHLYFGVHRRLPGPTSYITMLRNPVDRVLSHYRYVRRSPGHYLHQEARARTLREYVAFCGAHEPNNDQTRLLAGEAVANEEGIWTDEMLPKAQHNLLEHFGVVGISEEFDRSVVLMRSTFGWRLPYYRRENTSRERPIRGDLDTATARFIIAFNELDHQLHGDAVAELRRRWNTRVKGQQDLPGDGQWFCPLVATGIAHGWPLGLPGQVFSGVTPFPWVAWVSRMESPVVTTRWAWCMSRSTVALAMVLGMSSSNPAGCRLELRAMERFS
jgi:hypothetical protein